MAVDIIIKNVCIWRIIYTKMFQKCMIAAYKRLKIVHSSEYL